MWHVLLKRIAPEVEATTGSSLTASTAAKPTPKWPTVPELRVWRKRVGMPTKQRLRIVRGAPVLDTKSSFGVSWIATLPSSSLLVAASDAFCRSSTTARSR